MRERASPILVAPAAGPNIADAVILPDAEVTGPPSDVSSQQESEFYRQGGLQAQLQQNQQNLGLLGKLFGSKTSAPTNIAGFVVVASFFALALTFFSEGNVEIAEARPWLVGLIASAMSYIFGASSAK